MKTPSHHLFELVKSLNPREKVFFKIYSKNKGANSKSLSYLNLFNTIDKLKINDESLLRARLKKIGFNHHLNEAKNYLSEAIFNSLEEYHSAVSINIRLQKLLHRAEILIKKKLSDHAKKILLKAEKLALEYELYDYLMAISSLKENVLSSTMNVKDMKNYLNYGTFKEKKYLDHSNNIIAYRNLLYQVRLIASTVFGIEERYIVNKINSVLRSPLLSSPNRALSFPALKDYYLIHLNCAKILNRWDDLTCQRQKEWTTYLESDKTKFADRTNIYLRSLSNLMSIQLEMGNIHEAEKLYEEKIKYFYFSLSPKKRTKELLYEFVSITFSYMGIHFEMGNPEKSIKIWEQMEGDISLNHVDHNMFLLACNNLSNIYFVLGKYHDALKWANKILNFREKNKMDIQAMVRIYILLIHYELSNYDILPYILKSTQRFLIKHNIFNKFSKIMVDFFEKKISGINNQQQQTKVFRELKQQLEELFKNSAQARVLKYFEFISWVESKIENRPFEEIVKMKAGKMIKSQA